MTARKPDPTQLTYEQAVARLEAIVDRIESGGAGLEESIALFEEGTALGRRCRELLAGAEQRIEHLSRQAAGLDPAQKSSAPPPPDDEQA